MLIVFARQYCLNRQKMPNKRHKFEFFRFDTTGPNQLTYFLTELDRKACKSEAGVSPILAKLSFFVLTVHEEPGEFSQLVARRWSRALALDGGGQ